MRISRTLGLVAAAALAVGLTACSSSAPTDPGAEAPTSDGAFPVTIEHAYGETTIEKKPERIATVAWANHEVPLALGIVPVGMSKATWGDDNGNGVLPWVEEKLTDLGVDIDKIGDAKAEEAGDVPVLFDETDGVDFEAVADTRPDVILAAYSGLSQEEYDTLSKIAPVVAYPDIAWGTTVEDMTIMDATALGMKEEGEALVDELHKTTEEALAAHPALEGKKVLFSYLDPNDLSQVGYYTAADTRQGFLHGIGLPLPKIVEDNADSTEFYLSASSEQADLFADVDVFVSYGDDSTVAALQADPLLSKIPAIAEGRVAVLENATPLAASANPSPLSIPYNLDEYFGVLEAPLLQD